MGEGTALLLLAVHVLRVVRVLLVIRVLHVILVVQAILALPALIVLLALLAVETLIHLRRPYPQDSCTRSTGHENALAREDPVFP